MATTTHPVQIQPAARRHSIATLARAFSDDPVMRWVWPNAEAYATHWPRSHPRCCATFSIAVTATGSRRISRRRRRAAAICTPATGSRSWA